MGVSPILAVIPARGGSKGLPGKNIRPLAGLPLIAHSIRCARLCPEIARTIVSTDSPEIAEVARIHSGDVPFLRPAELARDDTAMTPVLQHALRAAEDLDGRRYGSLLLLDPTSPGRLPEDVARAVDLLERHPEADAVAGVSVPEFNPIWHCVREEAGYMTPLFPEGRAFERRQDLPRVYRINATLYLWRRDYLLSLRGSWLEGKNLLLEVPEARSIHIDDADEFAKADLLIRHGFVKFPWLEPA
jgi:N-acylneuraminate cytidylyltransferase